MGLFVRPGSHIPANKFLCVYASEPTDADTDNTDYMLERVLLGTDSEVQRPCLQRHFNLGRFVNQDGLGEGLK